uniref:Uncharacterized protein n=1 Tax=Rhizophora mucronata TaxID=61149 RepID=A0A2P2LAF7_RHIMU
MNETNQSSIAEILFFPLSTPRARRQNGNANKSLHLINAEVDLN